MNILNSASMRGFTELKHVMSAAAEDRASGNIEHNNVISVCNNLL